MAAHPPAPGNRCSSFFKLATAVSLFALLLVASPRWARDGLPALDSKTTPPSSPLSHVAAAAVVAAINGVSGSLWKASRVRVYTGEWLARHELDNSDPPAMTQAMAWFDAPPSASQTPHEMPTAAASECRSDRWAVITSIFAPSELMYQLERMSQWCTVVVADKKTPVGAWLNVTRSGRVKLLTVAEQESMGYRVLALLPWNHFGRKNVGYLFAIAHGARMVYDTDDDNILKSENIPHVDSRAHVRGVGQAWHCAHNDSFTRAWNPYVSFGAPASWPRGYPLDDITVTSQPCGPYADSPPYHIHGFLHPGLTFAVQQSLADVHPDIDGIHRLTRSPLTFSFSNSTAYNGLYGGDNVYSPYNAQATLHEYSAMWGMLLPVTVHGRVSDIW